MFHYHPDFNVNGIFEPPIDLYNDGILSTVVTQMQRMQAGNIGALIASWWGTSSSEAGKFAGVITEAAVQVPGVKITAYYESEREGGRDLTSMEEFMDYVIGGVFMNNTYKPHFLTLGGRPVLFVYDPGNTDCGLLNAWNQALNHAQEQYGVRPFLVVDMASNVPGCTNYSPADFAWHQYDTGSGGYTEVYANGFLQTLTIRPGFWRCSSPTPGQQRSLSAWQANVNYANSRHAAYFQLITSWNEWLEMSSVEPAVEWYSPSGLGHYLDILAQFPPQ